MSSRTSNSKRNIFTGVAGKIIIFLFAFLTRTEFARVLGTEYAGVDGLYGNILSMLSLADLGIGNVFSFFLYQSLAYHDQERIVAIVGSFRKLYLGIGIAVLLLGTGVIPFLPVIVDSALSQRELILYYVLYLINSAISYFFAYRTAVLVADQKQYISNVSSMVFQLVMYFLQFMYMMLTRDFVGYLLIMITCTLGNNIVLNHIAKKQYPYLKNPEVVDTVIVSRTELWKNIKATFIYRVSSVLLACTDNILISTMIGTVFVGKYAYYNLLLQYVIAYARLFGNGILAGIGNLQTENDTEKSYRLFEALNMFFVFCAALVGNIFVNCIQQFIPLWVGEDFLLDGYCVAAMVLSLYIQLVYYPVALYRESMGLFVQVQYIQIPAAIINIVLSVCLGLAFGVSGILLATSVSILSTLFWYEPFVLHKKLNRKVSIYFRVHIHYALTTILCITCSYLICTHLSTNILGVVFRFLVSAGIVVLLMWVRFRNTTGWKEMKIRIRSVFHF